LALNELKSDNISHCNIRL